MKNNEEHSLLAKQLKCLQSRQYGYQLQIEQLKRDISWYILQNPGDYYGFYYTEYRENLRTLYEDDNDLATALQIQKKLIEEKYGTCNVKGNFLIEDTIETLQKLT